MAHFTLNKDVALDQYAQVEEQADIVSFSSKTNPLVTKVLEENTNSWFSIHTFSELNNVQDKTRVLFFAQGWTPDSVRYLLEQGITRFVVDNENDLVVLLENLDRRIVLFLRVKLQEFTIKTERYYVFGMSSEVVSKRILTINNPDIEIGIHFHRKTQNMSEWNLQYQLRQMFSDEVINKIKYVNIGGGLPVQYANTNMDVIDSIKKQISHLKEWLNQRNILLVIEPGRFIAAPSGKLVTKIVAIHEDTIIVDASVYNTDMDALIVPVKLLVEGEMERGESKQYVVKGITPCSLDLFRYRVYLPEKKVGDELVFLNAGAYNFSSDFCDLRKLETITE